VIRPVVVAIPKIKALRVRLHRRRRGSGSEGESVPVKPDDPRGLSGGVAAALEFDD